MAVPAVRPLTSVPAGGKARVVALAGGHHFQNRLVSMGLNVGVEIKVVNSSNGRGGPMLIATGGTRLGIGHGMAERIMVAVARG